MNRIKYTCKNCGWETSICEQWEDLKPKKCMNKKCKTSFRLKPEDLLIEKPSKTEETQKEEKVKYGKKSNKSKEFGKTVEHQTGEGDNT